MRRAALVLSSLALIACRDRLVDPCAPFQGQTCIAVHLRGSFPDLFDHLSARVPEFGIDTVGPSQSPPLHLPFAVALTTPTFTGKTYTLELHGFTTTGADIFVADDSGTISPNQHLSRTLEARPFYGDGGLPDAGDGGRDDAGDAAMPCEMCGGPACIDLQHDVTNCGTCGHSCAPGESCNGECAPKPITPLASTRTYHADALFAWSGASPAGHIQICADPSCSSPIIDMAAASGFRPQANLFMAKPHLFWRVRYDASSTSWSATIPFATGRATSGPDTTTLPQLDWDGDSVADLAVGALVNNGSMAAPVFFPGTPTGFRATPAGNGPTSPIGNSIPVAVSVGDVNGDGYTDLAVGQTGTSLSIYFGGPFGQLSSTRVQTIPSSGSANFAGSIAGVGDFTGDGYADVAVTVTATMGLLYPGGPVGLDPSRPIPLPSSSPIAGVFAVGDVNGDGHGDVAVTGSSLPAQLFVSTAAGGPGGMVMLTANGGSVPVGGLTGGDLDGDGYSDVIAGTPSALLIYRGAANLGTQQMPTYSTSLPMTGATRVNVLALRDANADGLADCVAFDAMAGKVYLYLGNASTGLQTTPIQTLGWSQPLGMPGTQPPWATGDYNGDGLSDLALGVGSMFQVQIYFAMPPMGMLAMQPSLQGMNGFGGVIARLFRVPDRRRQPL